jgi:hypothetical protein
VAIDWRADVVPAGVLTVLGAYGTWLMTGDAWNNLWAPAAGGLGALLLWELVLRPVKNYVWTIPEREHLELWQVVDERDAQLKKKEEKAHVYRENIRTLSNEAEELKARLKSDRPEFVGFIDWMFIQECSDDKCQMLFALNITNAGAPSVIQHWVIRLTTEEGKEIDVLQSEPLPHEVVTFVTDVLTDIKGSDFIRYKTHPNGIPRGDGCRGFVCCLIPKNLRPKWSIVVFFNDAFGKTWESSRYYPASAGSIGNSFQAVGGWPNLDIRHRPLSSGGQA